jgi:hypothetical protein
MTFRQLLAARVGCVTGACFETNLAHFYPEIFGKKAAAAVFVFIVLRSFQRTLGM